MKDVRLYRPLRVDQQFKGAICGKLLLHSSVGGIGEASINFLVFGMTDISGQCFLLLCGVYCALQGGSDYP